MATNKPGCLGFLFGLSAPTVSNGSADSTLTAGDEGNIHSGPGGYEGMGYDGGYAADYFSGEDDEHA